jgi:hypothetical protein
MNCNAKQLENKQVIVTDIDALIAHIKGMEADKAKLLIALKVTTATLKRVDWLGSKRVINEALEIINEIENSKP